MSKLYFYLSGLVAAVALPCGAATFIVTTTNNTGAGSLRAAITAANTNADLDTIQFAITNITASDVKTITPTSPLPAITKPVIIDGYTQPGASANTLANADNAVLLVEINGVNLSILTGVGLSISGSGGGSTIRGLVLNNFVNEAIDISTASNVVEGCFIGTDPSGLIAHANDIGVSIGSSLQASSFNRIGGTSPSQRNVISGNAEGLLLTFPSCTNNVVQGNFIGTDATGTNAIVNGTGVALQSNGNLIGGTDAGARNVIAGNNVSNTGIHVSDATNNVIQGNFIGTDATGTKPLGLHDAIVVEDAGALFPSSATQIGGTNAAARNVIAGNGNGAAGIRVIGSSGTLIQGNFIGTDATGTKPLGYNIGISVTGTSTGTQIGGLTPTPGTAPGNVISANGTFGISIANGEAGTVIQGNLIGTDATGTQRLGNGTDGVNVHGPSNTIGGTNAAARNVISGNDHYGVEIGTDSVAGLHDVLVQNNFIGTDITGTNLLGNSSIGVWVEFSVTNTIKANVIAGNGGAGVNVNDVFGPVTGISVLGNSIFANGALGIDLGNDNAVTANDVGDVDPGANNRQNFPVITGVAIGGGNVTLSGNLNSSTNASFRLEFFSNPSCDSSGNGEGQTFLGFTNVTTDASGNAAFAVTFANGSDSTFTATATDTNGNTSEFSACAFVSGPCVINCPVNIIVSTDPNQCGANVNYFPTTSGNCGGLSVSPVSGSFFNKGTNTVTCSTTSGTNCSFTVTVNDTVAPAITCPASIVTNVPPAQTNAVVNYPAPVFSDNCALAFTNSSPPSGSTFPLGVTTVTCTASDTSGNTNTCSFTVTVTAPPSLVVINNNDSGNGSLRQAIADVAVSTNNVITFASNVTGAIALTTGELAITNDMVIAGPGAKILAINGNGSNSVFNITSGTVSISGLSMTNAGGSARCIRTAVAAQLTLTNCAIAGNTIIGGIDNAGTLTVINCTVSGNRHLGGAGAGINNSGVAIIRNTTISGNTSIAGATPFGGGIYNTGTLTVSNCTFSGNAAVFGAGIFNVGTATVSSSIIAQNGNQQHRDLDGAFLSGGYNLIGTPDGNTGFTNGVNHDLTGTVNLSTNALLGPLQYNGGPTLTHALLAGSPAIDNGNSFGLITDQRGLVRINDLPDIANASGGDGTDIGAFELNQPVLNIARAANTNVVVSWHTNGVGFGLEAKTDLNLSVNWSNVPETPVILGSQFAVTNSATIGNRFYRLWFP